MHERERAKLRSVVSIGERMIGYFEAIGIRRLTDLAGKDAREVMMRIDVLAGRGKLGQDGERAIVNVIEAANIEARRHRRWMRRRDY